MRFTDLYDLFVFDLDGTLADTRTDLTESVHRALLAVGCAPVDRDTVTRHVGDGARCLIERVLGAELTPERLERALEVFLASYRDHCAESTVLYPGAREALEGLRPKALAVLTNKPLYHSRKILSALGIAPLFDRIEGGDSFPSKKPDPEGLSVIARDGGVSPQRTLLIGDSGVDVLTARSAGARSAFVTYGFRPEAREETPPDHVLADLRELLGPAGDRALRPSGG